MSTARIIFAVIAFAYAFTRLNDYLKNVTPTITVEELRTGKKPIGSNRKILTAEIFLALNIGFYLLYLIFTDR